MGEYLAKERKKSNKEKKWNDWIKWVTFYIKKTWSQPNKQPIGKIKTLDNEKENINKHIDMEYLSRPQL